MNVLLPSIRKLGILEEQSATLEQKARDLEQQTASVEQKASDLAQQSDGPRAEGKGP